MNLLIADDHAMIRNALSFLLNMQPDMTVIDDAASGNEVFMKIEQLPVDIVLMDISMPPGENGLQTTKRIKEAYPHIKVIILTMHDEEVFVRGAIESKADGYILKNATDEHLVKCIKAVYGGERYYDGYSEKMLESFILEDEDPLYATLSKREKEILPLIALGHSNKDIAEQLFISVKTVEAHKANIKRKLKLANHADLLQYSLKHHLIDY